MNLRFWVALLALLSTPAASLAADRVWLRAQCGKGVDQEVRRLLGIELGSRLMPRAEIGPVAGLLLTIRCQPGRASIVVSGGKQVQTRSVPEGELPPPVWARLLALTAAELVELVEEHPLPPSESATAPARPEPRRRAFRLHALGGASLFWTPLLAGGGGGLAVAHDAARWLGWSADLRAEGGGRDASLGRVGLTAISAAALVTARLERGRLLLSAGLGGRIGAARFAGTRSLAGVEERAIWGTWAGPVVQLAAGLELSARWLLLLGVEAGYAALRVTALADQERAASIDGPWLTFLGGVGFRL